MSRSNHSFTLAAVDKMSAVIERVKKKFPEVTKQVRRSSIEMERFSRRTADVTKRLDKISKKTTDVGKSLSLGLTAPTVAFGALAFRSTLSFEKGMNKVEALTGATGETLANLREQAKKLGSETQFSAGEAADAMSFLGMAGWTTEQIMKGIPGVLDLAAASGTDLARAADIASNVMGAFKINAVDAGKAADVLARTTASSNVDMEMLAETMKYAAPVANKFGASLADTATLAGLLGNVGIQGSNAGTAIKNAMLGLAAPAGKGREILEAMGVTVADAEGNIRPFAKIMADMGKGLSNLPKADQLAVVNEVFGKISIAGASELIDSITTIGDTGKTNFEVLSARINDTNKTASSMAATMNKGAVGGVKNLISAFEGLQIAFMESGLLEHLTAIMNKVTEFMRALSKNESLMKFIAITASIAAVVGPIVIIFGKIAGAVSMMIKVFGILLPAMKVVGTVMAAIAGTISAPVLLITAAIAGLVAVIYRFRKEIGSGLMTAMGKVKGFFGFGGGESSADSKAVGDSLSKVKSNLIEKRESSESFITISTEGGVKATPQGPLPPNIALATGGAGTGF